jgi:hypothetical protein
MDAPKEIQAQIPKIVNKQATVPITKDVSFVEMDMASDKMLWPCEAKRNALQKFSS